MLNFKLRDPVTSIPNIGDKMTSLLSKMGLNTVKDILFHIPYRYEDTSEVIGISELKERGEGTFLAQIHDIKTVYTRYRKVFTRAIAYDDTDKVEMIWFNQPYLEKSLKTDTLYLLDGKGKQKGSKFTIYSPKYEIYKGDISNQTHLGGLTSVYPETKGVSSKWLRSRIKYLIDNIDELKVKDLNKTILSKNKLLDIKTALKEINFPEKRESLILARERLGFDEMLNVALTIEKQSLEKSKLQSLPLNSFVDIKTEFTLTNDQKKSIIDIRKDMQTTKPMTRLLNGDVGSGKTLVAAQAILDTVSSGYSAIILAPTTVLAQQHFDTFKSIFSKPNPELDIEICTSSRKNLTTADNKVIVSTHAILYQNPENIPSDLNLVIVDEQHRFGVKQRQKLLDINKHTPHYLTMTATPIPRSLTSIFFGNTDVSLIKEKPSNRKDIKTYYTPKKKKIDCLNWIKERIEESGKVEQAFFIYPIIEESEKLDVKSLEVGFEELKDFFQPSLKVKMLHGRMKDSQKEDILKDFKDKKFNILVSTSVVEVGIDIPNATIMVIEGAERFGLAQLHQLRGRVGRSDKQSFCYVIPSNEEKFERLKYFASHNSGFDVAEYDLQTRGPGEVYGNVQSGVPKFKVASITDIELLNKARGVAKELLKKDNSADIKYKKILFK